MRNQYGHCVIARSTSVELVKNILVQVLHIIITSHVRVVAYPGSKNTTTKIPVREDLQRLKARVMEAGVLQRQVENVIPQISWTPDFVR